MFAAGHAEIGNDAPVVMSTTLAERVDGGYRFTGHKMFGSNGPVWDHLGVHGIDMCDPTAPVIVHGFVERDADGVTVVPNWDTLGHAPVAELRHAARGGVRARRANRSDHPGRIGRRICSCWP